VTGLVLVSLETWDDVWRRNQHLAAGLLRSDPSLQVLFVEPATDPLHAVTTRRQVQLGRGLRLGPHLPGIQSGQLWLYQPTKLLPRRVDPRQDLRWAAAVVRAASHIGLNAPTLWVNSPSGARVLAQTGWPALYDITDDWLAADRSPADLQRLSQEEAYLLEHCDEVVVCSEFLLHSKNATRMTLIPNAVDVDAYRLLSPRPADLPNKPTALYVGTLHIDRLDVALCEATGRSLGTDGQLVLMGPDLLSEADRARLSGAGVVLLGPRDHAAVPAYLQNADVLVVPHRVTPFTESLDPIKVYEYRAAGRPVVSTPVPGFRNSGNPQVTVAEGAGFAQAVRRGLLVAPPMSVNPDLESVPTWDDRTEQMRNVLERVGAR
jgi:teichuronic acid biosynthesis glycosyltransferase TuaH